MNTKEGNVEVEIAGKKYVMVLDLRALSTIQSKYGDDAVREALKGQNIQKLVYILAVALKKNHPEITEEFILDANPTLTAIVTAVTMAWLAANFGTTDINEIDVNDEVQSAEVEDSAKKKTE